MPDLPPAEVLDLFAVPGDLARLPGDRGGRIRAGDLLLSPGRDPETQAWRTVQWAEEECRRSFRMRQAGQDQAGQDQAGASPT